MVVRKESIILTANGRRSLFKWLHRTGLPSPWTQETTFLTRISGQIYAALINITTAYMLYCYIYSIMNAPISFTELCVIGISTSQLIFGVFMTYFNKKFDAELRMITDEMDSITEAILNSELTESSVMLELYQKNAKLMALLTNVSLYSVILAPGTYCTSVPVLDWFNGIYRQNKPSPVVGPYDDHVPVVYELMWLLVSSNIVLSSSKKAVTDCLFISLMSIQICFLKYLSIANDALMNQFSNEDSYHIRRKLIVWSKLHQAIHRNIEKLINLFSPVLIMYNISIVNIVVCGAFVQMKKDNESVIQSSCMASYVLVTVLYYFLLSNTADMLSTEAENLMDSVYELPWYEMNKKNSQTVLMVLTKTTNPIHVTAYKAPLFLLNRETFAGFVVTATSAFVTFCQIQDVYS